MFLLLGLRELPLFEFVGELGEFLVQLLDLGAAPRRALPENGC